MLHAIYVGLFLLVAAPLIERIPLSALAGVLTVVAWNMIETHAMAAIFRRSRADAVVLMATLGLTVFRDLMEGIAVGVVLGAFVFMHRMAEIVEVEEHAPFILRDRADKPGGSSDAFDRMAHADDVVVFRIAGAFFFGAAARVGAVLDRIGSRPRAIVLDLSAVPLVDATGADTLLSFARNAHRRGVAVVVAAAGPAPRRVLEEHGLASPLVRYVASVEEALAEQAFAAASA
jgi:SulP family sulfate permease